MIRFNEPDDIWLDFVCANRTGQDFLESYDVVFGPVANDKVYEVVQFYENGVYDKDEALRRLKVENLYNQFLFHTEKSLTYCQFKGYEDLRGMI